MAGEGSAEIRSFSLLPCPLAFGIATKWSNDQEFTVLDTAVQRLIELNFERLQITIAKHQKTCIYRNVTFGSHLQEDVRTYVESCFSRLKCTAEELRNMEDVNKDEDFLHSKNTYAISKRHELQKIIVKKPDVSNSIKSRFFTKKLFVGAPCITTAHACDFPFFTRDNFDDNGELVASDEVPWKGTAWPNTPWSFKVNAYRQWCKYRLQETTKRGSFCVGEIWREWLTKYKTENTDTVPLVKDINM